MTRISITAAALAALMMACSRPAPEPAVPRTPEARLQAILATDITARQDSQYRAFEAEVGARIRPMLRGLALDASAPAIARANAVLRMGAVPMLDWDTYGQTMADPDPRVRGATLGVVGPLATRAPREALPILSRALVDTVVGIQAKGLQELRDRDLDLLRFYLTSNPLPELRDIALQTIRSAEAWGAPLTPDRDGVLRRTSPAGVEVMLRPEATQPALDLVIGTLTVVPPGGAPRVLADSVEAVANVIPAVVDPTGRWVAVETARRIEVHDLEGGSVRIVDREGLAPRPMPFTPDFLYFRPYHEQSMGATSIVQYEMLRAPFGGGDPVPFDSVGITIDRRLRGGMSPMRWARVYDRGTRFTIDTDGMRNRVLPLPGQPGMP